MELPDQIEAFADDLDKLVERYSKEYDLPVAAAIGVLQIKIHILCVCADETPDA